jgi:ribosomal protein L11 methylase PrmA
MVANSIHVSNELWYSISVTVAPEATEAIEYAFNSLEALGTEINHLQKKNAATATVVGYFNQLPDEEAVQDELHYALSAYGFSDEAALQVERSPVENTDWLAEWKKHWKPTSIGGFVIAPSWSEVDDAEGIVIRIEPNMAFGTGTHETTQLCLEAIEKYYDPGDSFLDVGTGTGILAIAAAKLNFKVEISNLKGGSKIPDMKRADLRSDISNLEEGSHSFDLKLRSEAADLKHSVLKSQISNLKLFACDTDVDSIAIAKENAELNCVGSEIEFTVNSISDETPAFDFVCANLTLDVILPILPLLIRKARKTLVLSGILADQKPEIVARLAELGIADSEIRDAGEWIRVMVRMRSEK